MYDAPQRCLFFTFALSKPLQGGGDVYEVRLSLAGTAGPIRLVVSDESGPEGGSLLTQDVLPVDLQPGEPSVLGFDGPAQLECGSRGVLGDLKLQACDEWGNLAEATFEVRCSQDI